MSDGIEHPDHTGESANPDAPWNATDAWQCPSCHTPHDDDSAREECWLCGIVLCESCGVFFDDEMRCAKHAIADPPLDHPLGYSPD